MGSRGSRMRKVLFPSRLPSNPVIQSEQWRDFVSSDYLVGGHFTRIQVQSQTSEHGLTLNSDSYLLAGQMFAVPRSLQSQELTWASGAFAYENVHSTDSTSGRNETKPFEIPKNG